MVNNPNNQIVKQVVTDEALKTFSQTPVAKRVLGSLETKRIEARIALKRQRAVGSIGGIGIIGGSSASGHSTARARAFYAINKIGFVPSIQDLNAALAHPQGVLGWLQAQASYTPGELGNFLPWGRIIQRNHQLVEASGIRSGERNYHQMLSAMYVKAYEDEQLKHYRALATTTKPALLSWILCLNNIMTISFPAVEGVRMEGLLVQRASYTYNTIAPNALGRFSDLIRAVAKSPEMLMFLDGVSNNYTSPNENFARELLELHTFNVPAGPDTYGASEIAFIARLLTGMRFTGVFSAGARSSQMAGLSEAERLVRYDNVGRYNFNQYNHRATGPYNFTLGQGSRARTWTYPAYPISQGGAAIDSFLNFVSDHPMTAVGICTRIAKWYFGDNPPQSIINQMIGSFTSTQGDLAALFRVVMAAIVNNPMNGSKYKTGEEIIASLYRIGGLINPQADVYTDPDLRTKLYRMRSLAIEMQHLINNAPTVEGYFNTAERQISPSSMLARMDLIRDMATNTLAQIFPNPMDLYQGIGLRDYYNMLGNAAKRELETLLNPNGNVPAGDVITAMLLSPGFLKR